MRKPCSIKGCGKPSVGRGLCPMHWRRWRFNGDPNVRRHRWDGHVRKLNTCSVPGCGRQIYKTTMCSMHRTRLDKHGDPNVVKPHARRHQFREDILDTWTRESAWLLGWIVTDGGIYDARSVKVSFDLKDREAIESIARVVDLPSPPTEMAGGYHRLRLHSVHMVRRLAELGIGPRKSLTLRMPSVPDEFIAHFVRGVVEGDGSLVMNRNYLQVHINSASPEFLPALYGRIPFKGSLFATGLKTRKNPLHRLAFTGSEALRFCEWIYRDSDGLRLTRKYDRYEAAFVRRSGSTHLLTGL